MQTALPSKNSASRNRLSASSAARSRQLSVPQASSSPAAFEASWTSLERVAAELGHELGPARLALGEALNALEHKRSHHELGFSSLNAYAVERTGQPRRWLAESRTLATQLERLTTLRRQLLSGRLSWTRAEVLAKLVERSLSFYDITNSDAARALRPALELSWFFRSSGLTCRELNERLRSLSSGAHPISTADNLRSLTLTVPTEDTWWFQAAQRTFRRVADRTDIDAFLEALLAETQNTLHRCASVTRESEGLDARDRWLAQVDRWRTRAERLCERARAALPRPRRATQRPASAWPSPHELCTWSPVALNRHVLTLAKQLHLNAAALGRSAEQLHRAEAWRHLGFASPGHYARDRLGVSLSSLKQKRALSRRLVRLPHLARALEAGQLGFVAALLVARIATAATERRWVERARQRTVKHLREEVAFVERIQRSRPGHRSWPPTPEVMRADLALRGAIVSKPWSESGASADQDSRPGLSADSRPPSRSEGHADAERHRRLLNLIRDYGVGVDARCSPASHRALPHSSCDRSCLRCGRGSEDSTGRALNGAVATGQTSVCKNPVSSAVTAGRPSSSHCTTDLPCSARARSIHVTGDGLGIGRTRLRLRVYESTLLLYRQVARACARQYPARRLLRSLCEHFLTVWGPVVARKREPKYEHIYERDAYTCTSPVCDRHDVTPHHLEFRSKGGGDEPENLASLCVWCHLEGVHEGRIRAEPKPDGIRWTIGRVAPMLVVDRDKVEVN